MSLENLRQRKVADYTGDDVDETTAQQCIAEAERLIEGAVTWRRSKRPDLVPQRFDPYTATK